MGFLDDVLQFTGIIPWQPQSALMPTTTTAAQPDFLGSGPGFDVGDIFDVGGQLLRGLADFPFNVGAGGVINLETQTPQEIGAGPPQLGNGAGGSVSEGARLRTTGQRTAMYIAGSCPGLWHTTAVRPRYDKTTGQFLGNVGGNRVSNRVSLVQDDSGALEFVSPVKATWSLKYKTRRAHTHRRRATRSHTHRRARVTSGHRHSLTRKQLAAGFGGKSHMKAHR